MRKALLLVAMVATLSACAAKTQIVREPYGVPTPIVPHPPKVERPTFELDGMPDIPPHELTEEQRGEYIK